jgi:hypothetical protein
MREESMDAWLAAESPESSKVFGLMTVIQCDFTDLKKINPNKPILLEALHLLSLLQIGKF